MASDKNISVVVGVGKFLDRCPICDRSISKEADLATRPFCSERCQMVDLGNWLDGAYVVPDEMDSES